MDPESRTLGRIKEDFSGMKRRFTSESGAQLISGISALLGIYGIDKSNTEVEDLLRSMIIFAKEKKLAIMGAELEFNIIKSRRK